MPQSNCDICKSKINRYDDTISCSQSQCNRIFHCKCINLSEHEMVDLNQSGDISSWECKACLRKNDQPNKAESDDSDIKLILKELKKSQEKNFESLIAKLEVVEKKQTEINTKYDEILMKLQLFEDFKNQLSKMEITIYEKNEEIEKLSYRINNLEQYSRSNNIEIREVAETEDENINNIILKIAKKVKIQINESDIEIAHRMKKFQGKTPAIICKFKDRKMKESFLRRSKITVTNAEITGIERGKVFISDNLSPYFKHLLWLTKSKAKSQNFKYVWWRGKILVRKDDGTPTFLIKSENDIEKYMN